MREEDYTIPEMVDQLRAGTMQRRHFLRRLAFIGISAAGSGAIVAAVASHQFAPATVTQAYANDTANQLRRHDEHLVNQSQGKLNELQHDYAEHAVVEDSMYAQPFVGRAAIMARKSEGMAALAGMQIAVTNRIVAGNQLTVEWVASGTHSGDYPGLPATGRAFSIPGVTVVVREQGKIVRESIYYDRAEVLRQLG
jgi:steroid delta-isomerase-like uncharacterized protein